jgi:hypothetical protein
VYHRMAVLLVTQCGILSYNLRGYFYIQYTMAVLRLTQGGSFSCKTVWQYNVFYCVAVLRIKQGESFRIVQVGTLLETDGGSFTNITGWKFYA